MSTTTYTTTAAEYARKASALEANASVMPRDTRSQRLAQISVLQKAHGWRVAERHLLREIAFYAALRPEAA